MIGRVDHPTQEQPRSFTSRLPENTHFQGVFEERASDNRRLVPEVLSQKEVHGARSPADSAVERRKDPIQCFKLMRAGRNGYGGDALGLLKPVQHRANSSLNGPVLSFHLEP
jgi:hypothetical protein